MGQHDPIDGFVTYSQLNAAAGVMQSAVPGPDLTGATTDFAGMIEPRSLATTDPLGLGGLLVDAARVEQLVQRGALVNGDELLGALLEAATVGLRNYVEGPDLRSPARRRLAFRELGLSIGLAAVGLMDRSAPPGSKRFADGSEMGIRLASLKRYLPVRAEIESFWLRAEHRRTDTWLEHEDINDVMLATTLVPDGFLMIRWEDGEG